MCRIMEDMRNESLKEYRKKRMTVIRMLSDGMLTLEKTAEYAGLPLEEVKKLKTEWVKETKVLTGNLKQVPGLIFCLQMYNFCEYD